MNIHKLPVYPAGFYTLCATVLMGVNSEGLSLCRCRRLGVTSQFFVPGLFRMLDKSCNSCLEYVQLVHGQAIELLQVILYGLDDLP